MSQRAGVKTVVLTHFVPGDDPTITDEQWAEGVRKYFSGRIIVGKDLMEIQLAATAPDNGMHPTRDTPALM